MAGLQTRGSRYSGKALNPTGGAPTKSDLASARRERRERDAPLERAFKAGQRGDDPAEFQTDDELWGYYQDGAKLARTEGRIQRREQLVGGARDKGVSVANDGAGFLLGLVAYALLANYLRHGIKGPRSWLSAKFLNKPTLGAKDVPKPATPSRPTTPAPRSSQGVRGVVG